MRTKLIAVAVVLVALVSGFNPNAYAAAEQPEIEARVAPILEINGLQFKDLNKNGRLDAYEDWRLPVEERVEHLLSQMTLEEKVGLLFHPNLSVPADGVVAKEGYYSIFFGRESYFPSPADLIQGRNITHLLNNGVAPPPTFAAWSNGVQEVAEAGRLGIPVTFSSDPRHGAALIGHVGGTQYFSGWPSREGWVGVTTTRDTDLAEQWGRILREEYRAVGLHMLLGPSIDLPTEPRWGRNAQAFTEDAELATEMLTAFLRGALGDKTGPNSMAVMVKHWPGSGPHLDGEGRLLVYPGENFEYHLIPFRAAFEAGAQSTMSYYSATTFDNLAVSYSDYIISDVLRGQLGFDGIVCTDWGVIGRVGPLKEGYTDLSLKERYEMALNAGIDQFGGESDPTPVLELVQEGRISEDRIDHSAAKLLKLKFDLGLFEDPYVDTSRAGTVVGSAEFRAAGYQAQLESIVLLANDGTLPLSESALDVAPNRIAARRTKVFTVGIDSDIANRYAAVVEEPAQADVAIVKVDTGDIQLTEETLALIDSVVQTGVPVVLVLNFDHAPTVVPPALVESTAAMIATFDVLDEALFDVLFGRFNPVGKLAFQIPSTMESVEAQLEDVPRDLEDPTFDFGHGLSY